MALVLNDRVRETTTIVGTGTATLLGAAAGYQSFSVIGNANTCYYTISDQAGTNWEVGIGTYVSATPALARTTVLKSSNSNNLVSFPAGTKDVFVTYPAETAVSGGGGGTYPTIQPTLNLDFANTKLLDPRITFVRNNTATYYDGQTTAMAEQNLLLQSQAFNSSPWAVYLTSITANTIAAPDGTNTAETFASTTSGNNSNYVYQPLGTTLTTPTLSVYAKAGTTTFLSIVSYSGAAYVGYATFDLSAGTVAGSSNGTASIVSAGNGWYRCILSLSVNSVQIYFQGKDANPSGHPYNTGVWTSGTDLYIWGAQLEQRSSATAYTPTTTTAITNYIPVLMTAPAGVARFDCDPITGKSLGLLIEEIRVNLLLYSATFSNAAWTLTNATLTAAATIAPDGTQTAFNLVSNTSTGLQAIAQTITKAASALAYTSTVHFKANQYTYSWLQISDGAGNGAIVYFNLTTGAISTAVAGIGTAFTALSATTPTSIGNGWYRCNITGTSNTTTSLVTQFGSSTNGTSNSVVGNGYSGVFIWGAQAE